MTLKEMSFQEDNNLARSSSIIDLFKIHHRRDVIEESFSHDSQGSRESLAGQGHITLLIHCDSLDHRKFQCTGKESDYS